eukprot:s4140_g2.t1
MREFRWSWADVGLLKSGLAKAGAGWHSADRAGQAAPRLKLKDKARPLHFIVKGKKEFRFADAGQAVAFLRPLADADALRAVKTRKPLQDVDQLLGELPDAQKAEFWGSRGSGALGALGARISRSLHCPSGHPIQRKGESVKWYQARPPALEQLPSAPAVPALAAPKQQVQEPAPSPMKAQLDTLLGLLSGSSAALPPEAQQMIAALQETNSQSNAKGMHRAVADQAKARQTLARIQTQKATYLQAWHAYVSELAALLETQLAEQAAVMSDFEEKELQWSQAEAQASQQLARMTGASGESTEAGEREMEISEELADTAAEAAARLRQSTEESQASAKQMLAALRDVQQTAAEQVQQSAREGSRTPRRTQTNEQPAGIGQQEAKPQLPAVPPRSKPGTEGKDAKPGAPPGAA